MRGLLTDSGDGIFGGVVGFKKSGDALKGLSLKILIYRQRKCGELHRFFPPEAYLRGKAIIPDILQNAGQLMHQHFPLIRCQGRGLAVGIQQGAVA